MEAQSGHHGLVDRFGRVHNYLRLSITDRCDFRCQYCMPERGVEWQPRENLLNFEETLRLAELFRRLGFTKFRLTGGEPTVRKGYVNLVSQLSALGGATYLTTNGGRMRRDARELVKQGLTGVNISIDSLRRDRFEAITRRDALHEVLDGIDAALEAGIPTKLNVVVMAGVNEDEIVDFVGLTRDRPLQVRFIEFMPFLDNAWSKDRLVSYASMLERIDKVFKLRRLPGEASDVGKDFDVDGHQGTVGFVTSMTDSFCGGCNRLRMTADGRLKTCLFLPPRTSLRDMIRSGATDDMIELAIRADLETKWAAHPPIDKWQQRDTLSMVQIGG